MRAIVHVEKEIVTSDGISQRLQRKSRFINQDIAFYLNYTFTLGGCIKLTIGNLIVGRFANSILSYSICAHFFIVVIFPVKQYRINPTIVMTNTQKPTWHEMNTHNKLNALITFIVIAPYNAC
ncbi:hypothetical protein PPYR_12322 [Photinus pyralis]|uniref:Uncharacterized protein n=1 Tax=Photinus pyralis TaxID=7054 RepID=A0A5N4ADT0_PHOPY|nr:hypothetical protein PPYR_12322 [Photinus pyralis]